MIRTRTLLLQLALVEVELGLEAPYGLILCNDPVLKISHLTFGLSELFGQIDAVLFSLLTLVSLLLAELYRLLELLLERVNLLMQLLCRCKRRR